MRYLLLLSIFLASCSPGYVMRAAYEEGKILACREKIEDVLADPETTPLEKEKLALVAEAREFSKTVGLDPGGSFKKYSRIDRDVVSWVVMGARKDSFRMVTWWFPIVGSFPYKGFFSREEALDEAKSLEKEEYETWVRGADAFSTLGWFDDPVLSTILKHGNIEVVNTVMHETTHTTVWIKDHADFNKSLANFVGTEGALLYFEDAEKKCQDLRCKEEAAKYLALARDAREREYDIANRLTKLYGELEELYKSPASTEEKLEKRKSVFEAEMGPVRARYPALRVLKSINNAEIMQLKLYMTELPSFTKLFEAKGRNLPEFIEAIRKIRDAVDKDSKKDPFALLKEA